MMCLYATYDANYPSYYRNTHDRIIRAYNTYTVNRTKFGNIIKIIGIDAQQVATTLQLSK